MKFTLSWLKSHLDTTADLRTIIDLLTMTGLEVDAVIDRSKDLAPFRAIDQPVGKLLCTLDRSSASSIGQQGPNPAAASGAKQPHFPVADLPS